MNKTTKKPGKRLSAENIATGKRLLKYIMEPVQVPFYHGIHLYPSECSCFYLGISVSEISCWMISSFR